MWSGYHDTSGTKAIQSLATCMGTNSLRRASRMAFSMRERVQRQTTGMEREGQLAKVSYLLCMYMRVCRPMTAKLKDYLSLDTRLSSD